MKRVWALSLMFLFTVGCVATTTHSRVWHGRPSYQAAPRPGYVEWIREVIHRQHGDPAGGALAGAIIGGILGGRGAGALFGAAGGAMIGAAASQGHAERRAYEVAVRFHDGGFHVFVYDGWSPFGPGEPVMMTPGGLARM